MLMTKSEGDGNHPASHYLVVEDPKKPTTWHLRVKNAAGQLDHGLMGAAWAALHGGYRGNTYAGPNQGAAIAKLTALYKRESMPTPSSKSIDLEDPDTVLVTVGDEIDGANIKDLGDGRVKVGGYLVRFSPPGEYDLTGDRFDKDLTDFGLAFDGPQKSLAWFNHRQPVRTSKGLVAVKRRFEDVTLTKDDVGIFMEGVLNERNEYEKFVADQARAGKMGLSSGTAAHLVDRQPEGKGNVITSWILGGDASYTHAPAEFRNSVTPLKSWITAGVGEAAGVASGEAENVKSSSIKESEMPDNVQTDQILFTAEEVEELTAKAVLRGIEAYKKLEPSPATNPAQNVQVITDAADQPWKSAGEYFQAVRSAAIDVRNEDARLRPLKATGMSEGQPADGGYLLAPTVAPGIMQRVYDVGQILSRVAMDTVGPNSNSMVYNAVDESSRATTRYGGVLGYWLAEGSTKLPSAPKFRQVEIKLKKVAALAYATDELLADATALQGWLTRNVPEELRFQAEDAIYNGDGVGKPTGIMNSGAVVSVTRTNANQILLADVVNMYARRWGRDFVWLINRAAMPQLMQLGSTYQFTWMPPGGLADSPFARLLGYPVIEIEYAADLGTTGDIMLADLSQYQCIQKGGIEQASSIHVQFLTDETVFRFVYRMNGASMWNTALTPFKGTNTLSPFVTLTTST